MANPTYYDDAIKYEAYENWASDRAVTRQARRKRKPKTKHVPKMTEQEILTSIAETVGLEAGFNPTYKPSLHEEGWLIHALKPFFEEEFITDVLAQVKGGKEANVYLCAAHESLGTAWVAAKVYRPKMFRTIRNDTQYRDGRPVKDASGVVVKANEKRAMKALRHKSGFGQHLAHQSWMMHEFAALESLHTAGAAVPKPIYKSDNSILMEYIGNADEAAPTLNKINLTRLHNGKEIYQLFHRTLDTIEMMLRFDLIHGDLSAYNILYWQGDITVIDFPQTVVASKNSTAYTILLRDVKRVCQYFQRQGVRCRPHAITDALWHQYIALAEADQQAEFSRLDLEENTRTGHRELGRFSHLNS